MVNEVCADWTGTMTIWTGAEVLCRNPVEPVYAAETACIPRVKLETDKAALPFPSSAALPSVAPPSLKTTEPVGVPELELTIALSATAVPEVAAGTDVVIEVDVGAPDGPLFARGGPQGNATTDGWVSDGTTFFLQDVSNGQQLNQGYTIATQTLRLSEVPSNVSFQASPNPIVVSATTGLGSSTLFWNAPDAFLVEVHLNSPAGPLFARGLSMGSATAPGWVHEGLVFYLQDISGGKPLNPQNTLATVTMHVVPGSAQ